MNKVFLLIIVILVLSVTVDAKKQTNNKPKECGKFDKILCAASIATCAGTCFKNVDACFACFRRLKNVNCVNCLDIKILKNLIP